jgi:hypothetical protein
VVLYVLETWSLTLRKEHKLRVFENSAEEDVWTGGWRKLHNEILHDVE